MTKHFKHRIGEKWCYIGALTGIKIVHADYFTPFLEQSFTKMRAKKSRTTGYEDAFG